MTRRIGERVALRVHRVTEEGMILTETITDTQMTVATTAVLRREGMTGESYSGEMGTIVMIIMTVIGIERVPQEEEKFKEGTATAIGIGKLDSDYSID
jgi:hypothetical protein